MNAAPASRQLFNIQTTSRRMGRVVELIAATSEPVADPLAYLDELTADDYRQAFRARRPALVAKSLRDYEG